MSNASEDFYGIGVGDIRYTPPTDKQSRAVQVICSVLDIQPPDVCSFDAYSLFISEHIEKSRQVAANRGVRYYHSGPRNPQEAKIRAQKEADWKALNLDGKVWTQQIMDGETIPPSWANETLPEAQYRLRGLGCRTRREEDLEREVEWLRHQDDEWF